MAKNSDSAHSEIIKKKLKHVHEQFERNDQFSLYILDTLNNFAYRYLDNPISAQFLSSNIYNVTAIELGIKEAIKIQNPVLRTGISHLVKRVSREQGPTIMREIRVELKEFFAGRPGVCLVSARISFGHPQHDFSEETYVAKLSVLNFQDEIHFRNNLAKNLEEVCELFS